MSRPSDPPDFMPKPKPGRYRCDLVEVLVISFGVMVSTWLLTHQYDQRRFAKANFFAQVALPELQPIEAKYGPQHFSRDMEEWIIRDAFQGKRNGVFLDVGANHYQRENNTYYLETALGWSGIAVEAQSEFGAQYATHRPRTRFVALFASDVPGQQVQFFVPKDNKLVASSSHEFTVAEQAPGVATQVPTTTLNVVLEQAQINRLDFLSMDIELSEPKALAGFDVDRYKPSLVCIEGHAEVRQQILDYFAKHGYVLIGKYLRADPKNLYFRPLT